MILCAGGDEAVGCKGVCDLLQHFFGFGSDGVVVVTACDVHKLCRLACAHSFYELFYLQGREDVKGCRYLAVYLVPDKYVCNSTSKPYDKVQFFFGLLCGVVYFENTFFKR